MANWRKLGAPSRLRRFASWLPWVMCACAALQASELQAADTNPDAARENQLRVGYLLNFARFVEWPQATATDSLILCFVGSASIRDAFITGVAGKSVGSHPIVARIVNGSALADGCRVLYIESAASGNADYLSGTPPSGILTVSDTRDFIHKGGIVELFAENNRLRFSINLDNAHRAGLKISSSLLQLASHVEETGR